jgi:TonB family protein
VNAIGYSVLVLSLSVLMRPSSPTSEVEALRHRAAAGDVQAEIDLAAAYATGTGVRADAAEAHRWVEAAASHLRLAAMLPSPRPYRVAGDVKPPKPIYTPDPPLSLRPGLVVVTAVVGADGRVKEATVARSQGKELDRNAIDAVRRWLFQPATLHGRPVPVKVTIEVVIPPIRRRF